MDQMVRADRLFDALNIYIDQVPGPTHKHVIEALQRLSQIRIENIVNAGVPLDESALQALRRIYPQTCEYLGEPKVRAIIRQTFGTRWRYRFHQR